MFSYYYCGTCKESYDKLINNTRYSFNDYYGITYLTPSVFNDVFSLLTKLRKCNCIDKDDLSMIRGLFNIHGRNYSKIKKLEAEEPRIIAQKFIKKKNIRHFIFKRDEYKCLKCHNADRLAIDHIIPISKGGKNTLSNLQTLCTSCNSKKSDTYKDYRK